MESGGLPPWSGPLVDLAFEPSEALELARLGVDDPRWTQAARARFPVGIGLANLAVGPELRAIFHRTGIAEAGHVLDAAAGPGVTGRLLLDEGTQRVTCVDSSNNMLEFGARLHHEVIADGRLTFDQADLREPLPFADNAFEATWWGDLWVPEALPELRRITRGPIVVKLTGVAPPLRYAFDRAFNARLVAAKARACFARYAEPDGEDRPAVAAQLRAAGFTGIATVPVERFSPLPRIDRLAMATSFGQWVGGHLRAELDDEDWTRLEDLWTDDHPDSLLRRDDLHLVEHLLIAVYHPAEH